MSLCIAVSLSVAAFRAYRFVIGAGMRLNPPPPPPLCMFCRVILSFRFSGFSQLELAERDRVATRLSTPPPNYPSPPLVSIMSCYCSVSCLFLCPFLLLILLLRLATNIINLECRPACRVRPLPLLLAVLCYKARY